MTSNDKPFPDDKTAQRRRQGLSEQQIKDLELAGGVEGGMQAGSGGPPAEHEEQGRRPKRRGQSSGRDDDPRA